ncbi:MAG: metallophosphoesterase family protein [Desulfonatronovibrionaceae bacterium]
MLTFIHSADFHLDSPLLGLDRYEGAPVQEIRQATRKALANLVDHVLKQNIPLLIISGDLYDDDCPDFQTLLHFCRQMDRLGQAGTRVALIQGNHDAGNPMTGSLPLPGNVTLFSSRNPQTHILEDLGVALHGQSYARAQVLENLVRSYPDPVPGLFNIGLLHTSLSGTPGESGYAPCRLNDLLARDYQYWALGHNHRPEIVHDRPLVVFPGCIQGRHIREPGPKGCVQVQVNDSGRVHQETVTLDVFRWQTMQLDISGLTTMDQIMDQAALSLKEVFSRESGNRPMGVRLILKGTARAHDSLIRDPEKVQAAIRRIATEISGGTIWMEKIIQDTRPMVDWDELGKSQTPQGHLIRFIDQLENHPEYLEKLGINLTDLSARIAGTGVSLPDLSLPGEREKILEKVRNLIVPYLST